MVNFCTKCGEKIDTGTKFCPKCGSKIGFEDASTSQPQYPQPQDPARPQYGYSPAPGQQYPQGGAPRAAPSPQPSYYPRSYNIGKGNKLGGAALAIGIIGCCCTWFVAMIFGIVAVIVGAVGISQDDSPGLAIAGIIFGVINIIFFFVFSNGLFSMFPYF